MPAGDRTGPAGHGPLTGRRLGYCAGYHHPGYMNEYSPVYGRGLAHRRGPGRGFGRGYRSLSYAAPSYYEPELDRESEVNYLKETAKVLEDELKGIREQISKLEEDSKE